MPHPDDETLGTGGLIQRVLKSGGKVHVVFMTSCEGYARGVEEEDHISTPTPKDYRGYGALRRHEALKADATLGIPAHDVIFLGFPDDGLSYLRSTPVSSAPPYLSPATMENRPPKSEQIIHEADYTRRDLTKEMERVIAEFRPTIIATTPAEDWHPDHNATYFFVKRALNRCEKKHPRLKPTVLTFLIHFEHWPVGGADSPLKPPIYFPGNGIRWVSFTLKPDEAATKRKAILEYRFQMLVMDRYLMSFVRPNELYILDK